MKNKDKSDYKKIYYIVFLLSWILGCATGIEKERLELDKKILEFNRDKLEWEKKKSSNCCCCDCNVSEYILVPDKKVEKQIVEYISNTDCPKVKTPSKEDIWKLAEKGDWSYHPSILKTGEACKDDWKESFYKVYHNTESYVAETQVPKTKQSSCINNVLFHGKDKLYNLMIEKTFQENGRTFKDPSEYESIKKDIIAYNNKVKGRSFYYECIPTDPNKNWDKCSCVLYSSHEKGKVGLLDRWKN
jgi:hypothetical protein